MTIAVSIAVISKKALEVLASNKDGRKFLGYSIGIAAFVALIPLIVVFGLFGWMSGDNEVPMDHEHLSSLITPEQLEQLEQLTDASADTSAQVSED